LTFNIQEEAGKTEREVQQILRWAAEDTKHVDCEHDPIMDDDWTELLCIPPVEEPTPELFQQTLPPQLMVIRVAIA
jgi:hypothetical protein